MPPARIQLTQIQLKWLQEMQQLIDKDMSNVELDPKTSQRKEVSESEEWVNWNLAHKFQGQLICAAAEMKIPEKATPDVFASWNAIRNRLGKGPILYAKPQQGSSDTARPQEISSAGPGGASL
ncbi:hypothetical protein PtB15_12B353 [Puccinia triticina]|nr:hypothetical protein PtB15_12B353 [Puccinia triticina]